jgi:predicted secreted Zn-dependent protease
MVCPSGVSNTAAGALAALLAAVFLSACTVTGTQIDKRSYAVYGDTRAELKKDIRRRGPKGGSAFGLAEITFYPIYQLVQGKSVCRVTSAQVGLHVILTEPKWRGSGPAPRKVAGTWRRFSKYVRYHEGVHSKIAKDYAKRMKSTLLRMSSRKGCADLRIKAQRRIKTLKRRHLAAQEAFDQREKKRIKHLI